MDGPFDVLVVGAGCAGMRAAIEAHDAGARVAVVSKLHPTRSHSGAAEGGINAALGNKADDDPETHALVASAVAAEQVLELVDEGITEFHFFTLNRSNFVLALARLLGVRPD